MKRRRIWADPYSVTKKENGKKCCGKVLLIDCFSCDNLRRKTFNNHQLKNQLKRFLSVEPNSYEPFQMKPAQKKISFILVSFRINRL